MTSQGCLKIGSEQEIEANPLYLWIRVGRPVTQDRAKISSLEKNLLHLEGARKPWWVQDSTSFSSRSLLLTLEEELEPKANHKITSEHADRASLGTR